MGTVKWRLAEGKTWRGKLEADHPSHGKIVEVPAQWRKSMGSGTLLIPRPRDVDAILRRVPKGKLVTQSAIRERLARDAGADHACPLTTGIFLRIVAEAAEEDRRAGKKRITPYWRAVKDDGKLHEKFPGGVRGHAAKLRAEGVLVRARRGMAVPRVVELETRLSKL